MVALQTQILHINVNAPERDKIELAGEIIKKGGTVAFPTETVYGLGANALSPRAVDKIFKAKGRPQDNPLILHISDFCQLEELVEHIPHEAKVLAEAFWPGPLTMVMERSKRVPDTITAGLSTVAIRMPDHRIALELIRASGLPIAAPSANTSGRPSPTEASHVIEDLNGRIDMIIDGGQTGIGVESTVLDITGDVPTILRPGGVTQEDLLSIFPRVDVDPGLKNEAVAPKSPGQKYRHYSPKARVIVIEGSIGAIPRTVEALYKKYAMENLKVGIMATEETRDTYTYGEVMVAGDRTKPWTISANLFKILRDFDKLGVDIILIEGIEETGLGRAIMNRVKKAAREIVIADS